MATVEYLRARVDEIFAARDPGLLVWPAPREFGEPAADWEYSHVSNPDKWRVLGVRADAWLAALAAEGLARVEAAAPEALDWGSAPGPTITSAVRVVPEAPGALSLVVARSLLGGVPDAGVTLGVGDPPVAAGIFPDCGCDACDGGAQQDLDALDDRLVSILTGTFRRLTSGSREITVVGDGGWGASGVRSIARVEAIIARPPRGWRELSGAAWL